MREPMCERCANAEVGASAIEALAARMMASEISPAASDSERSNNALRKERRRHAHGLCASLPRGQGIGRGREELQLAKPGVDFAWALFEKPVDGNHECKAQDESYDWRTQ